MYCLRVSCVMTVLHLKYILLLWYKSIMGNLLFMRISAHLSAVLMHQQFVNVSIQDSMTVTDRIKGVLYIKI